jgi:uroporphyrinogen decarboxylase
MSMEPNFDRFRTVLLRRGEPDYVPLGDISVHPVLKEDVWGKPIQTLEDEVAFWSKAGYDYVPVEQGLQLTDVIRRQSMHSIEANYGIGTTEKQTRFWATEGKGLITTRAEFEAFKWPDPDSLDYVPFEKIVALLPPKVKVI